MAVAEARSARLRSGAPSKLISYIDAYRASPSDRIRFIRDGVPAEQAKRLVDDLRFDQVTLFRKLNLKIATVNRKAARDEALAPDEGERVVGIAKLVGQLEVLLQESGDPDGFDAFGWLSRWLSEPLPSLGGVKPIDLLDTMEGQSIVSQALSQIQSGAYA